MIVSKKNKPTNFADAHCKIVVTKQNENTMAFGNSSVGWNNFNSRMEKNFYAKNSQKL